MDPLMNTLSRCLGDIRTKYWELKKSGIKPDYPEIVSDIYGIYEHMLEGMTLAKFKSEIAKLRAKLGTEKKVENREVPTKYTFTKIQIPTKPFQLPLFK